MRLKAKTSPLVLLLLPAVATVLASSPATTNLDAEPNANANGDASSAIVSGRKGVSSHPQVDTRSRRSVPTRDAPVDGKDGKPHLGPFVDTDRNSDADRSNLNLPPLSGRPEDPTMVDGKRIPETNDGVMFDKNRERPQEGTTGTEGGVSEKDRARKAQEGKTGEKVLTQPESPKEQPPLPHSEEQKIRGGAAADNPRSSYSNEEYSGGLDKPDNLPERTLEHLPGPNTANTDPLALANSQPGSARNSATDAEDEEENIIQPFHSFVLSLTMILFSEVGDKTFLVAALMAMKHDRMVVFSAAFSALLVMTVLSAFLGHVVPSLLPKWLTSLAAAVLFFAFGAKLLKEGMDMDPNEGVSAEMHEVEQELAEKEKELGRRDSASAYALEMGLNGRSSRSKNRFSSPVRSPSQSPSPGPGRGVGAMGSLASLFQGTGNLFSLLLSPAWVQTFVMTFLGEWGDRSQIATIAMAAGQDYWWVILGALVGHAICTGAAVVGGRAVAGRVSLKVVTVGGAVAFLVFGFIYLIEALW